MTSPLGWMHQLSGGESPGWNRKSWLAMDLNHANVWAAPFQYQHKGTGKTFDYTADFEQTSLIFDAGFVPFSFLSLSLEFPVAFRMGGFLDSVIDGWHTWLDFNRFNRELYPKYRSIFQLTTDGQSKLSSTTAPSGLSNIKLKAKFWFLRWKLSEQACACGISASTYLKIPLRSGGAGLSSGGFDGGLILHLGIPFSSSGGSFMTTFSFNWLGKNKAFEDWPRKSLVGMAEGVIDIPASSSWGFIMMDQIYSPFMDKNSLTIPNWTNSAMEIQNKISSGWNSFVQWRNFIGIGFRYSRPGFRLRFLIIEDGGIGSFDGNGDNVYVTNDSDIQGSLQLQWDL